MRILYDFYPRPPWGGRPGRGAQAQPFCVISIHALRGEGDLPGGNGAASGNYFYPRPPWGGRPGNVSFHQRRTDISIHALRGEGDRRRPDHRQRHPISIHALRGEGDIVMAITVEGLIISIHALRGEGDSSWTTRSPLDLNFYPRPPWGGRRQ